MTTWKPVPGFEGIYSVSACGLVRRDAPGRSTWVGRLLGTRPTSNGYHVVALWKSRATIQLGIHRIVLLAFVGQCPPGLVVNHKDGNKSNNRLENLEYVTESENNLHTCRVLKKRINGLGPWKFRKAKARSIRKVRLVDVEALRR